MDSNCSYQLRSLLGDIDRLKTLYILGSNDLQFSTIMSLIRDNKNLQQQKLDYIECIRRQASSTKGN